MGNLNLIRKIYFNVKTLIKNIFLKFEYVFINAVIGWNFSNLNVSLCFKAAYSVTMNIFRNFLFSF